MSVYFSLHRCCLSASASLLFHVSELESPGGRRAFRSTLERVRTLGRAASSGPEENISFRPALGLSRRSIELRSNHQLSNHPLRLDRTVSTQCFEGCSMSGRQSCLLPSCLSCDSSPGIIGAEFVGSLGMLLSDENQKRR